MTFLIEAIQVGTVLRVTQIGKMSMPLAVILAVMVLDDRPTPANWLRVALIVAGSCLAGLPRPV